MHWEIGRDGGLTRKVIIWFDGGFEGAVGGCGGFVAVMGEEEGVADGLVSSMLDRPLRARVEPFCSRHRERV